MANPASSFGFKAIGRDSGGPIFTRQYGKPSSDATAIFMNDPVVKAAVSIPDPTGLGNPAPGITSGQNGTPGTTLWQGVSVNYGAASTATPHYVVDEIDALFIAEVNGSLSVTTASHVGKNANIATGTGNALTKQSTFAVANGSIATTQGLDLRIMRVSNISPNAEGANAIVEVIILKHELGQNTAGI